MESKAQTPSVIAKLMGLDSLPPQQPSTHRQQSVFSENYLQRTASIGIIEKQSSYHRGSFKMNFEEQREFKDIFEVPFQNEKKGSSLIKEILEHSMDEKLLHSRSEKGYVSSFRFETMEESCLNVSMSKIVVLKPNHYKACKEFSREMTPSRGFYDWKNRFEASLTHSSGSSKSSTLGEMLAKPELDQELSPLTLNHGFGKQRSRNVNLGFPLGISSKDGWKEESFQKLPRSKTRMKCEANYCELCWKKEEEVSHRHNKSRKQSFNRINGLFSRKSRPECSEPRASGWFELKIHQSVQEACVIVDEVKIIHEAEIHMNVENHATDIQCEPVAPVASIGKETSLGSFVEAQLSLHSPKTYPKDQATSEDAYNPSPVSVLEPPYQDYASPRSEDFERVNAADYDSSDAYSDEYGIFVSSDEDTILEENRDLISTLGPIEKRDFFYLVDALHESGFHYEKFGMSFETWQSEKCPLSPSVFDKLEKKHNFENSWVRSERRLLFDRINAVIVDILKPNMNIHGCMKPVAERVKLSHGVGEIEEALWMRLGTEKMKVIKDKELGCEMKWFELKEYVDEIGRDIGSFLIDELVEEVVNMDCF